MFMYGGKIPVRCLCLLIFLPLWSSVKFESGFGFRLDLNISMDSLKL